MLSLEEYTRLRDMDFLEFVGQMMLYPKGSYIEAMMRYGNLRDKPREPKQDALY